MNVNGTEIERDMIDRERKKKRKKERKKDNMKERAQEYGT